jgi:hypothetical protein
MNLTSHERKILEELRNTRGSRKKRFFIDLLLITTSLSSLVLLFTSHKQNSLILLASALCGGLIGSSIEKFYARKIFLIALKLYKTSSNKT